MTNQSSRSVRPLMDYSGHVEVTISRPVRDVWPYFFNMKKDVWSKMSYTRVAGESGQVGEIFSHPRLGGGESIYEAIVVEPYKRIVLKITFKNEDSVVKLGGYDIVNLQEAAGSTTVIFDQATELPAAKIGATFAQAKEAQDFLLADILQTLKHMVENEL